MYTKDIMYCLSCKTKVNSTNIVLQKTKNNRTQAKGVCPKCHRICTQFVKTSSSISSQNGNGFNFWDKYKYGYSGPARRKAIKESFLSKMNGGKINGVEFKDKALTTEEVNEILKPIPGFIGTFPKDEIPDLKPGSSIVVNLHDSFQPGSHWVCSYMDKDGINGYFFDSYGLYGPEKLIKKMKDVTSNIFYNHITYQHEDSELCGYFCAWFIIECYKKDAKNELDDMGMNSILSQLTHDTIENEEYIKNYFS